MPSKITHSDKVVKVIYLRFLIPYWVLPTNSGGASGTYKIPDTSVSLRSDFAIPANLQTIQVSYKARLGEPIRQIPVFEKRTQLLLPGSAITPIAVSFDTNHIIAFWKKTISKVFPINVDISLQIKDQNGNSILVVTHCLIEEPGTEMSAPIPPPTVAPTPTPTPTPTATATPTPTPTSTATSLTIDKPVNGTPFKLRELVKFKALKVGPVTNIKWESDLEAKVVGTGEEFSTSSLRLGNHRITLSGDSPSGPVPGGFIFVNITN